MPSERPDALSILATHAQVIDRSLRDVIARFARGGATPPRLVEAMEYSLFAGGKRLRPALVIESFLAVTVNAIQPPSVRAAACAIELIHTFSLVHDDLPAMDDDDLRRGKPTNHKVFGEATAILAGDAMVALAFETLAADAAPDLAPPLVRALARATGVAGMIGGQVLDLEGEGRTLDLNELSNLHRMKTGALLVAACEMGAICGRAREPVLESLRDFGGRLGLAFQIVDDLLDVTSSDTQLGKRSGKDLSRGKNTFPALLGIDATRAAAAERLAAALGCLAPLGSSGRGLRSLAEFVIARDH